MLGWRRVNPFMKHFGLSISEYAYRIRRNEVGVPVFSYEDVRKAVGQAEP